MAARHLGIRMGRLRRHMAPLHRLTVDQGERTAGTEEVGREEVITIMVVDNRPDGIKN